MGALGLSSTFSPGHVQMKKEFCKWIRRLGYFSLYLASDTSNKSHYFFFLSFNAYGNHVLHFIFWHALCFMDMAKLSSTCMECAILILLITFAFLAVM
jgi:hypothetical protein